MQNVNNTNGQNGTNENLSLVNVNILQQNLSYIKNVAQNNQVKNNLVQDVFFDYLENKAKYKAKMIEVGYLEDNIKNKDIAKFYFNQLTLEVAKSLFSDYGVELKEVTKDDKTSFKLTNTKKTFEADNIIKGTKEYLRNNFTLLDLISTNNLKLRIKLIDFRTLREIILNLNNENEKGFSLKALINSIDVTLSDIEYLKALKARIKEVKENNKTVKSDIIDLSKLKDIKSIDEVLEQLKALKESLIVEASNDTNETQNGDLTENITSIKSDDYEIIED